MHAPLHLANMIARVGFGTAAFLLGALIMFGAKGTMAHRARGRVFVWLMAGVVATAVVGLAFFRRDPVLGAVTFLVAYQLFSGVRSAKGRSPDAYDNVLAMIALSAGLALVGYVLGGATTFWRPQVTAPIGMGLVVFATYDLLRLAAPRWRQRVFQLEHGFKMIGAMGALASAGAGTLAPGFQPSSQVAPSAFFSVLALSYVLLWGRRTLAELRGRGRL